MNFLRLRLLPLLAVSIACVRVRRVFCRRRHGSTEDTIGSLEKARSVSLRVPDARGRNLEDPR